MVRQGRMVSQLANSPQASNYTATGFFLRARYAMTGTDVSYAAPAPRQSKLKRSFSLSRTGMPPVPILMKAPFPSLLRH